MSSLPIILKQRSESVGLFTRASERELGLDRARQVSFILLKHRPLSGVLISTRGTLTPQH